MPSPVQPVEIPFALFDHNWAESTSLSSSWDTVFTDALSADEQRRGLMDKPYRLLKRKGLTLKAGQSGDYLTEAKKATGRRFYSPLGCDQSYTTQADAAGVTIHCDTVDRRFYVGFKAMVVIYDRFKKATNIHVGTIALITSTTITFSTGQGPSFDVPSGASVYPAIECDPNLDVKLGIETDTYVVFDLMAKERVGATALPALYPADSIPGGELSYQGFPILSIPHTWDNTEGGELRKNTQTAVGLDVISEIYGATSLTQGKLTFQALQRSEAFRLLRFFDCRCGSLFAFWVPNQTQDLEIAAPMTVGSVLLVRTNLSVADLNERKFICIWTEKSPMVYRIIAITDSGGGLKQLTLDNVFPTPPTGAFVYIAFASLAKFATDNIEEEWQTDGTMRTSLPVVGVPINSCFNGEAGDNGCDPPPIIPDVDTPDLPEDPWEPHECGDAVTVIQMFEDSTQAKNQWKEAVRAADLAMPPNIYVTLDAMVQDSAHTHGSPLSDELLEALFSEHKLEYVGVMTGNSSGISRCPYHARVGGPNGGPYSWFMPALPGLAVTKRLWRKTKNYIANEIEYQLEIRFVSEWTEDRENGAWGAINYIIAFSNEVNPSYSEGSAYAPSAGATFFRNDPFVWGNYYYGLPQKKLCHPQALVVAMTAMSWHSPVGYRWFPPADVRFKECHKIQNGAPWSTGNAALCLYNTHFGDEVGATNMGPMSLGGAFPTSGFFEWCCIENAAGYGLTALKPTHAGWDEALGDLTIGTNNMSVRVCNPGQNLHALNPCRGHPDEPFEGVGGSHTCWRSSGSSNYLCISPKSNPSVKVTEICKEIKTTYGPFDPLFGDCRPIKQECLATTVKSSFTTQLHDYYLGADADPGARTIEFRGTYDDPDYDHQNWVYHVPLDLDQWGEVYGAWSLAAPGVFTNTSIVPGSLMPGFLRFLGHSGSYLMEDGHLSVKSKNTTATVAIVSRLRFILGIANGYFVAFNRSTNSLIVYLVVGGVTTPIATTVMTDVVPDRVLEFFHVGAHIGVLTARTDGAENELWACEAYDCTFLDGGQFGLAVLTDVAGVVFEEIEYFDQNWRKQTAIAGANSDTMYASANPVICEIHKSHLCQINTSCSTCDCVSRTQTVQGVYAAAIDVLTGSSGGIHFAIVPLDGHDPSDCVGDGCAGPGSPKCGSCPPPTKVFTLNWQASCEDPEDPSLNPYKLGFDVWTWEPIVCP